MPPLSHNSARTVLSIHELLDASREFAHPRIAAELARASDETDVRDLVLRVMLMIVDYTHGLDKYVLFSALEDDAKNVILNHPSVTPAVRALLVRISRAEPISGGGMIHEKAVEDDARVPFDRVSSVAASDVLVPETPRSSMLYDDSVVPETPQTLSEDEYTSWQPCQRRRVEEECI